MIPILLRKLHFNNRLNRNIEIRNKNDGLIYIYQNSKWVPHKRDEILEYIVDKYLCHLDIYWSMNNGKFSNFNIKNFNNFKSEINTRKQRSFQKRECEMAILNMRNQ